MARPLRLEYPGAVWHVTSRGNEKKSVFHDEGDRKAFLPLLARSVDRFGWRIHAFVLMTNHYHLLLETPEPTLSAGMRELNGIYTQRFNRRHERVGHLFQGRFKGILVEKESHLLELTRYVVLNPVRAGIAEHPADWRWSSYRATAGLEGPPTWLVVDWTLAQFGQDPTTARCLYRRFVLAGANRRERPWDAVAGQIYLGGQAFQRRMRTRIEGRRIGEDVPKSQVRIGRPTLDWIVAAIAARPSLDARSTRAMIAFLGREDAGERLAMIGAALSVKPSMASRLASHGARLMQESRRFRSQAEEVRRRWAATGDPEYRIKV